MTKDVSVISIFLLIRVNQTKTFFLMEKCCKFELLAMLIFLWIELVLNRVLEAFDKEFLRRLSLFLLSHGSAKTKHSLQSCIEKQMSREKDTLTFETLFRFSSYLGNDNCENGRTSKHHDNLALFKARLYLSVLAFNIFSMTFTFLVLIWVLQVLSAVLMK